MIKRSLSAIGQFLLNKIFLRSIGAVVFILILWSVDTGRLWSILSDASLSHVILGILMSFPVRYARSFRWNRIKKILGIDIPPSHSFFYQLIVAMAHFTPAKLGEFLKAFYLKSRNFSFTKSSVSIIGDRIFDLMVALVVAVIASFYFLPVEQQWTRYSVVLVPLLAIVISHMILIRKDLAISLGRPFINVLLPEQLQPKATNLLSDLIDRYQELTFSEVTYLTFISLVALYFQIIRFQLFAIGLGFYVSTAAMGGIIGIMSIGNLLPITVSGLGTRDAVFMLCFKQLGINTEFAISLSILVFLTNIFSGLLGSVLFASFPPSMSMDDLKENLNREETETTNR